MAASFVTIPIPIHWTHWNDLSSHTHTPKTIFPMTTQSSCTFSTDLQMWTCSFPVTQKLAPCFLWPASRTDLATMPFLYIQYTNTGLILPLHFCSIIPFWSRVIYCAKGVCRATVKSNLIILLLLTPAKHHQSFRNWNIKSC